MGIPEQGLSKGVVDDELQDGQKEPEHHEYDGAMQVLFDDGKSVVYSVKEDIETIESYKDPEAVQGLSEQADAA